MKQEHSFSALLCSRSCGWLRWLMLHQYEAVKRYNSAGHHVLSSCTSLQRWGNAQDLDLVLPVNACAWSTAESSLPGYNRVLAKVEEKCAFVATIVYQARNLACACTTRGL